MIVARVVAVAAPASGPDVHGYVFSTSIAMVVITILNVHSHAY
jgi:hypothetical protein